MFCLQVAASGLISEEGRLVLQAYTRLSLLKCRYGPYGLNGLTLSPAPPTTESAVTRSSILTL